MTPQSELEIKGNLFTHPFAELLAEIAQARLNGSLRLSDSEKKCVIYFRSGRVVFAVSNARSTRLFDILLRRKKLTKEDLVRIPNFSNDFELTSHLQESQTLTREECDRLFTEQIEGIIVDILSWKQGDWIFTSLARLRDGLAFETNVARLLVNFARCLPVDQMLGRFRSLKESFSCTAMPDTGRNLSPEEAFVLSRALDRDLSAEMLVTVSGMSETAALQAIYTLWIGGLLVRNDWQAAFSESAISTLRDAKLALVTEARPLEADAPPVEEKLAEPVAEPPAAEETAVETIITLTDYLERVERATTYYEILGVEIKAEADELKKAYFSLAKNFHPDRYHSEGGEQLKRIQRAFTELAQAHETLKNKESREVYDYRMRKELAEHEKRRESGDEAVTADIQMEQAANNFDRGFSLLLDNAGEAATPFLARAAHFAPGNARYRAYYGKALSFDDKHRHKAEGEMQAAVKLDPDNATFRILLAEFFIQVNLLKRAEGELTRLLEIFPSNREARNLLDTLNRK